MDVVMELDRGLRAVDLAKQLETVDGIPGIFERARKGQNFALLMKLSEHFRCSNNEIRGSIAKALNKALIDPSVQADEIVKRLIMVWESNDVYARAHVLDVFTALSLILGNSVEAHYRVMQSLYSDYEVEFEAATNAALALSKSSFGRFVVMAFDAVLYRIDQSQSDSFIVDTLLQVLVEGARQPVVAPIVYQYVKSLSKSEHLASMKANNIILDTQIDD